MPGSVVGVISSEERRNGVPAGVEVAVGTAGTAAIDPPADLLVDTVGGEVLLQLLPRVRPGGRAALVGYTKGERIELDLPSFMFADVALLPVNGMRWRVLAGESLAEAARAEVERGGFPRRVETYPLGRATDAFAAAAENRANGRVVLLPRSSTRLGCDRHRPQSIMRLREGWGTPRFAPDGRQGSIRSRTIAVSLPELDPQIVAVLRASAEAGIPPIEMMPPVEGRAKFAAAVKQQFGPVDEMFSVEDRAVDGVPVRIYRPDRPQNQRRGLSISTRAAG